MTKDWCLHKAEIEQLYLKDNQKLSEVERILRAKYGFDASIRAYRMKLDEWGFRKYESKKEPLKSTSELPVSPDLLSQDDSRRITYPSSDVSGQFETATPQMHITLHNIFPQPSQAVPHKGATRRQELNRRVQRTYRLRKEQYILAIEEAATVLKERVECVSQDIEQLLEENFRMRQLLLSHGISWR